MEQIVLSGNSPGELWGWIRPLIFKFREKKPDISISLFLFPCPYATGKEVEVAQSRLGVDTVFSSRESIRTILFGQKSRFGSSERPVLIHLGGDLMYAALLGKRLKAKTYSYQWGTRMWDRWFAGYFVAHAQQRDLLISRGIPAGKIEVVGDLVADAIELDHSQLPSHPLSEKGEYLVTFFPGSRKVEITHMLPHFLKVAEKVKRALPVVKFALALSPFVDDADISEAISPKSHVLESSHGVLVSRDREKFIQTEQGALVRVSRGNQIALMQQSDCIVTIPGTKSGEAGMLGTPMLVVFPTNKLELIPYPGLLDFIGKIPVAGNRLKRFFAKKVLARYKFLAQPNILSGEKIVPEIVGELTAARVADALIQLLLDKPEREKISGKLRRLYEGCMPGAEKLVTAVLGGGG